MEQPNATISRVVVDGDLPAGTAVAVPVPGDGGGAESCCVVCTEPLEWVAVGPCGHRVVCSSCMVHIRFANGDMLCCLCRTPCPKVVVIRGDDDDDGRTRGADVLTALPSPATRSGRVDSFWYLVEKAAYFADEQQHKAARAACKPISESRDFPWWFR